MKRADRPKREYRSFDAYVQAQRQRHSRGNLRYPCLRCDASGRIIAPYERPDPVEGWKMADRITCPGCGGTKEGTRDQYKAAYQKMTIKYWEQVKEWDLLFQAYTSAVRKVKLYLTHEEARAIGISHHVR